jgi:hypothetical protein
MKTLTIPNINSKIRIVIPDNTIFINNNGESEIDRETRFLKEIGYPYNNCEIGLVGEMTGKNLDNDKITFIDWQKTFTFKIDKKYIKEEKCTDVNGYELVENDIVYVAVSNKLKKVTFVGSTCWKHLGYNRMELGARFRSENGKCFTQFYPEGRLFFSQNIS